jgi:hypothetical protein
MDSIKDIVLVPEIVKIVLKNNPERLINKYTVTDLVAILNISSNLYEKINKTSYEFSAILHLITMDMLEKSAQSEHHEI